VNYTDMRGTDVAR
jgi:hypothetical protein